MEKFKSVPVYIVAYSTWIISFLLWLYFLIMSRIALLGLLGQYFAKNDFQRNLETQFFDRAYVVIVGIIWLVMMIVVENSFRVGIKKGNLSQRIYKVLSIEMVLISITELALASLIGFNILPLERWLQLLAELAVTGVLVWLWIKSRTPTIRPGFQ